MRFLFFNSAVIANSKMDYCLSFKVTSLVENHPWVMVMVTTCIKILTISSIIIVVYLVNNSSL